MDAPNDSLQLATALAREAGALLMERWAAPRTGVETKSTATDMVTDADRAAESLILDRLRAARPDDAILGEESGERAGTSGVRWVIDPLDGTTNFLYGIAQWCVSIACEDDDGVTTGVVYDPVRDELFAASRGGGATLNGAPIRVSALDELSRALVATGFAYRPDERHGAALLLPTVLPAVRDIRRAGAAALDLAWTACGRVDVYFETPIQWWDVAAGSLIVQEAGGRCAEIPSVSERGTGWMAAPPGLFEPLRALVERAMADAAGA